jgi:hypothetical protein
MTVLIAVPLISFVVGATPTSVQIAIVYNATAPSSVTIYRNGLPYGIKHTTDVQTWAPGTGSATDPHLYFGKRFGPDCTYGTDVGGFVEYAGFFDVALSQTDIGTIFSNGGYQMPPAESPTTSPTGSPTTTSPTGSPTTSSPTISPTVSPQTSPTHALPQPIEFWDMNSAVGMVQGTLSLSGSNRRTLVVYRVLPISGFAITGGVT